LILPSGGLSGLPNEAALAEVATPKAAADIAAPTRILRLSKLVIVLSSGSHGRAAASACAVTGGFWGGYK
jgi:hypothetical protein